MWQRYFTSTATSRRTAVHDDVEIWAGFKPETVSIRITATYLAFIKWLIPSFGCKHNYIGDLYYGRLNNNYSNNGLKVVQFSHA